MSAPTERDVEHRLRAALAQRAARATSGDAVRDALARAERPVARPRPTSRWLTVAAAAVAVATVVPVGLHVLGDHGSGHLQGPTVGTSNPTAAVRPGPGSATPGLRLTLRPGWLPPGLVEGVRGVRSDGTAQIRQWNSGRTLVLEEHVILRELSTADPSVRAIAGQIATSTDTVTVEGHRAMVKGSNADATLDFQPEPDRLVEVLAEGMPNPADTVKRIARSIEPDPTSVVVAGMAFGVLPAGLGTDMYMISGDSPANGVSTIFASTNTALWQRRLTADLGPTPPDLKGGTPVTVRGLPGTYVPGYSAYVSVRLVSGKYLTVKWDPLPAPGSSPHQPSEAELVAIADGITFPTAPDYSSLGR